MIASGIKMIKYFPLDSIKADLTASALKTLLAGSTGKEVTNVHQDTWDIQEAEASVTGYKNQLTGKVYRNEAEPGEIYASFTIGEYDYETKQALMGGELIQTGTTTKKTIGWKRGSSTEEKHNVFVFLTKDDQYCVFPKAKVVTREANTDKAIGLAVKALNVEPDNKAIASEYWFNKADVDSAT